MVVLNSITDPDMNSCFKHLNVYDNSKVFIQVNGTTVKPSQILKAYDDDTGCRFIKSCMVFAAYVGCLPSTSEFTSVCMDHLTRESFLKMVTNKTNDEFYIEHLDAPLNQFCMIIAAKVMTSEDLIYLQDTEHCKYAKYLEMMTPYDSHSAKQCLTTSDIVITKKNIMY
ncbi:SWPV1-023 [Shearwaterpox virus]|uniref:SWPV1-023 n=1 Tax=Shearwaterpox virus TaxID=1974596 RepID=A0A1V0S7N9_CNPV|nr:SWPV1-023 [Shearwaterpox virus]